MVTASADSVKNAGAVIGSRGTPVVMLRRHVPDDNDCLFSSIAYVGASVEERAAGDRQQGKELREYCATEVSKNDSFFGELPNEIILGRSNEEYAKWIQDPFHWGGENEILVLAKKFDIEVAVVSSESLTVSVYNEGANNGRGFILYTGQHYDPLVAPAGDFVPDAVTSDSADPVTAGTVSAAAAAGAYAATTAASEVRCLPTTEDADWDAVNKAALELAKVQQALSAKRAAEKHEKALKCLGCGAICKMDEFQQHCTDVEHDDDFMYDCDEVIVCDGQVVQKLVAGQVS